ncbi:MAG: DUF1569 domain-containing protein [Pseudomonadota bacterium]
MSTTRTPVFTRRRILTAGLGALAVGAVGTRAWLVSPPAQADPTVADALAALDRLERAEVVRSVGTWSPYRVFNHLAQSVELSLTGYPEHKPALFKRTVGRTAFAVFRKRGKMHHGLDEAIPGAPALDADGPLPDAIERLRRALLAFDAHRGPLAPHFAYGPLDRQQYAVAHAMHLNNHLVEIVCDPPV